MRSIPDVFISFVNHAGKAVLLITILLTSSCTSRIPEPIGYPYRQQEKMQASHHWEVLAYDLADRINNQLILSDNTTTPVFVEETCGDDKSGCNTFETSPFNEAFRDLLITQLVAFGVPTLNARSEEGIDINYKVQVVRHQADRLRTIQPGVLTTLSAMILVMRDAPLRLLTLATGTGLELANTSYASSGHYEVIITTSLSTKDRFLFRASDIYYINDVDFWHYQEQFIPAKDLKLAGPSHLPGKPATEKIAIQPPAPPPPPPPVITEEPPPLDSDSTVIEPPSTQAKTGQDGKKSSI